MISSLPYLGRNIPFCHLGMCAVCVDSLLGVSFFLRTLLTAKHRTERVGLVAGRLVMRHLPTWLMHLAVAGRLGIF